MDITGIVKFTTKIALVVILAVLIDAAICAATGRWTLESFIRGLEYAGFLALLLGGAFVIGGFNARGSFGLQYARSVEPASMHQRTRRSVEDMLGSFASCIQFGIAGVLLWVLAAIMDT